MQTTTAQVAVWMAGPFDPALCSGASHDQRIRHEEIARLCGLSRQVVGRALHELEHAGLVRLQYGTIHVLDVEEWAAKGAAPGTLTAERRDATGALSFARPCAST
ncbi:MAG TPA: helix-turn-helix domain-containing protein [Ideonella sp.]|uniref:helix-turn-helix domain-containing protein n=1 Tax=Ideonella sp. TaxID=1929293 RepID=UPI002E34F870|nr:helix-turn-helix domain-containing protein [Ideonella sp.]HEX5684893.1 helix-turn-helix domain-containing protein [Ideonella sp.]